MKKVSLYNLLIKYGVLKIIPIGSSFFESKSLPEGISLSKEAINLNYSKLSPIKGAKILSYRFKNHLYLWFIPSSIKLATLNIPEGFLLFLALKKQDGVHIVESNEVTVLVIKDGVLKALFLSDSSLEYDSIAQEFSFSSSTLHLDREKLLKEGLESLDLLSLKQFFNSPTSRGSLMELLIERATYPIIGIISIFIAINYTQGVWLKSNIKSLEDEYHTLRAKSSHLTNSIRQYNKKVEFLEEFEAKELKRVEPFCLLAKIAKAFKKKGSATIEFISISTSSASLRFSSKEDSVGYIELLNSIDGVKSVILQSTFNRRIDKVKIYSLTLEFDIK